MEVRIADLLNSSSRIEIRPSPDSVFSHLDGECVVLNYRAGTYFGLQGAGSEIWHLLQNGVSFDALCAQLEYRFHVDAETCRRDAATFIMELSEHGLVELTAQTSA